jgi:diguanylate cyclase (GGDEF)-like protein
MRDSIRLRGETLYNMYLTDDFIERDEYRLEIAEHALRYKVARDILYSYRMSAREAKLLDLLMKQTRAAKALNDSAAENMLSDLPRETIISDLRLANNARQNMLVGLDDLVLMQETNTSSIIEETKQEKETIGHIILFLSLAAFFIAVYIAQLVIRETSRKNSEIQFQATHDELTKLVNRKEFNHRLQDAFKTARETREHHALCFLDLDNFKVINDSCGHKAGDKLLIQLTRLIKKNIRSHDTLARIGGDEFGLLLEGCSLDKAIEISEGIVNLVKNYEFVWQDNKFHVGVSIGLAMITHETKNIETVLSHADIACYAAKDMGRNQVQIHGLDDERIKNMHKELSWVADINNSKNEDRFSLFLQAIEDIDSEHNTSKFEVLLRLNDDGKIISPGSYIPVAERFSLMGDVDKWVVERTFKHLAELYKSAPDCDVLLFINISANSLTDQKFAEFVIQQYKKHNIAHDAVCLEISEMKAVKNLNQTAELITTLRRYNVQVSLDDFGAGSSSFSYLKARHFAYGKIDGNIVKNLSRSTADKAMIAAISEVGKVMNIKIIAKHVENIFTLNQLKEMGINYAQGFYLEKPSEINRRLDSLKKSLLKRSVRH